MLYILKEAKGDSRIKLKKTKNSWRSSVKQSCGKTSLDLDKCYIYSAVPKADREQTVKQTGHRKVRLHR